MAVEKQNDAVRAYLEYFRDMGVHDFYRNGEPDVLEQVLSAQPEALPEPPLPVVRERVVAAPVIKPPVVPDPFLQAPAPPASVLRTPAAHPPAPPSAPASSALSNPMAKPVPLHSIIPLPEARIAPADRAAALRAIQEDIGDCTRCPLAYAGRRRIVFADGDPNARLMFVGEGPGADEDASGIPFVGKAGQLLNNMISAMGLKREEVYIANIVKCRPPGNRNPEPVEAETCRPFLARQIDVVQPEFIVALGSIAATYLLGLKQSISSLRGTWRESRGARVLVTYHPAFLLRDPSQKGEAWKDLQMVMAEMGLKGPKKA